MNSDREPNPTATGGGVPSEALPELSGITRSLSEPGSALEAFRAFDDGALAEVPNALEAYLSHQRFDHI